ncbi:BnaA09g01770D [Brassica napus]|uniref:BnaA09g01770D protein n=1 Tax=Brassica napus TaxID=3708 RepID=A0A078IF03_BRANA|nr:BnaA09g01770D [Brassica napus]
MKEEEVNRCQIQNWYPKFKSLTIKTKLHKLPESFINYLLDDSVPFLLPSSVTNQNAMPNRIHNPDEEDDDSSSSDDETDPPPPPSPSFPELEIEIRDSIEALGGSIFPKLNWSAPKDAAWISPSQSLSCSCFSEIALLLRSSDSILHDLCNAYDSCSDDKASSRPESFFLALRKWYPSLKPEMEFRCFVKANELVGVCQREVTTFYPVLVSEKEVFKGLIEEFFDVNVRSVFELEDYVFDVYVTKERRVKVVDFNTWCGSTLPLMFSWEELEGFRGLVTAVPYDYIDVSCGSGWDQVLKKAEEEFRDESDEDVV